MSEREFDEFPVLDLSGFVDAFASDAEVLQANNRRDLVIGLVAFGVVVVVGLGVITLAAHGLRSLASSVAHG